MTLFNIEIFFFFIKPLSIKTISFKKIFFSKYTSFQNNNGMNIISQQKR